MRCYYFYDKPVMVIKFLRQVLKNCHLNCDFDPWVRQKRI